jgi:putative CocE/NonD family hydrolase
VNRNRGIRIGVLGAVSVVSLAAARGVLGDVSSMTPDMIQFYDPVRLQANYVRRELKIPMRDGVKLFTVAVMRKGLRHGPILLVRTPYGASEKTLRIPSQDVSGTLPIAYEEFVNDDYIIVFQDVRGQGKSEGDYVVTRPLRGPLNHTAVDHATDAYDTIDWLTKNLPETNGRVGVTGSSYAGFTSLMALIDPHPALKAVVSHSPMVDGWRGDDWFHNGAFRQSYAFDYIVRQTARAGSGEIPYGEIDDYEAYLNAGSAGDFSRRYGLDSFPFVKKFMEHPAYDAFWQEQAVDRLLAQRKLTVPTMLVVGQWDQEDSYGAPAVYRALEPQIEGRADMLSFVIGPWRHSGSLGEGSALGPIQFSGDTALWFRQEVMKPFLDRYLKEKHDPVPKTPNVLTYATGEDRWERADSWPVGQPTPLYLQRKLALGLEKPAAAGSDRYVSDPAKPVPFLPRPIHLNVGNAWKTWLVSDQRFTEDRTDVLSYKTETLTAPVHVAGAPSVDLFASTSGSDSDWVIKLIDVYPQALPRKPELAGYEMPIGIEIFRGRYLKSLSVPAPLTPNKIERYKFTLPNVDHVFEVGHRIMVQVQSSLFPLYDRNPQTYVANIFDAPAGAYKPATQTVVHTPMQPSAIWLPLVN